MARRVNIPALCAAILVGAYLTAEAASPDGSLGFAAIVIGVGAIAFAAGWRVNRWSFGLALGIGWFVLGFFGGGVLDPAGYAWAIGLFAPIPALFATFGVGSARSGRPVRPAR